jgi:ubiquitin C-terminal hydrolase
MFLLEKLNRPQVLTQSLVRCEEKIDMETEEKKAERLKRTTSSHHQLNRLAKIPNVEDDFLVNGFQLGLPNFGNTCYINALVQCLFGIKSIIIFLFNFEVVHGLSFRFCGPNPTYNSFLELIQVAWKNRDPQSISVQAREFVRFFQDTFRYLPQEQQDATEAYCFFTEFIDEYFNRILKYDIDNDIITIDEHTKKMNGLSKLSSIECTSTYECEKCGYMEIKQKARLGGFIISLDGQNGANTIEQYIKDQCLFDKLEKVCSGCSVPTYKNIQNQPVVDNKPHLRRVFIRKLPDYLYCYLSLFELDVNIYIFFI